ncbi:MAG TPA: hypothetical protein VJR89_29305 [Polyangiales bacterium]|nr:hypothetical protein [Polyangiales bacterium]
MGCAGELRDPDRFGFLFDGTDAGASADRDAATSKPPEPPPECVTKIFQTSCKNVTCHGAGAAQVDLVSTGVENRIVGKKAATCKDSVLIATDDSDSFLVQKVTQMQPPCGQQMPPTGVPLTDTEQTCLTNWADSLANTN